MMPEEAFSHFTTRVHAPERNLHHCDVVEVSRVRSEDLGTPAILTRYWIDNELAAWSHGAPGPGCHCAVRFTTSWSDPSAERDYWLVGDAPIAPTIVQWRTGWAEITPSLILREHAQPARHLPGATLTLGLELRGFALDPNRAVRVALPFVDGQLVPMPIRSTTPDLTVTGDAPPIVGWVAGAIPFRSLARGVRASGDPMLLGAAAGVIGVAGGLRISPKVVEATHLLCSLVEDHRYHRDSLAKRAGTA